MGCCRHEVCTRGWCAKITYTHDISILTASWMIEMLSVIDKFKVISIIIYFICVSFVFEGARVDDDDGNELSSSDSSRFGSTMVVAEHDDDDKINGDDVSDI